MRAREKRPAVDLQAAFHAEFDEREPGSLLLFALKEAARSVHIDLTDEGAVVKARIRSRLENLATLSMDAGYALADVLEDSLKGDHGVLELQGGTRTVRFRLSACPSARGQRLVVTFLPQDEGAPVRSLDALAAPAGIRTFLDKLLDGRQGMILVAGLQGSRRWRTIGALGGEIEQAGGSVLVFSDEGSRSPGLAPFPVFSLEPGRELWRLMDQVEGMDADCVVLPDIRSLYHVNVALAMSGPRRLSLAPIRAQDCAGALVKLRDLGAGRYRVARDLAGVIAQQRLPKPCPHCSRLHHLTSEEVPERGWNPISRRGLLARKPLVRSRGHGCEKCSGSGYSGWTTIYETLEIDAGMAERIREFEDPGRLREELKRAFRGGGLLEAAWAEILKGNAEASATATVPGPGVSAFELSPAILGLRASRPAAPASRRRDAAPSVEDFAPSRQEPSAGADLRCVVVAQIAAALDSLERGQPLAMPPLEEAAGSVVEACGSSDDLVSAALCSSAAEDLPGHCFDVAVVAVKIAANLGWESERLRDLAVAAFLHDAGLMRLPSELRHGEERSAEQERLWRGHPIWGEDMILHAAPDYRWLATVVRQSHERESGAGFPDGLEGAEIDPMAKVLGLADRLKSLTSPGLDDRAGMTTFDAIQHLNRSEEGAFDKQVFAALTRGISIFPVGSLVQLNDRSVARVASVNPENFHRPEIEVLVDPEGRKLPAARRVKLADSPMLYIAEPLRSRRKERGGERSDV